MSIKFLCGIDVDNGVLYTDTSNNRVGINTSSPQVPLEAKYTGTVDEIIRIVGPASGKPQLTFYNDTTLHTKIVAAGNNDFSITNTHSTGDMFFATGGATRLHIESDGKVGIGTNTPGYKLDVNGSIKSGGNYLGTGSAYTYLSLANGNYHHKFYTRTNTTAASERFTIEGGAATTNAYFSNVNVGIGTTSPSRKLQVIGTDGAAKFYYNSSFTNAQYSVVDVGMMTSGTAANGVGPKITFRMGGNGYDGYATGNIGTTRNGADNTHNLTFGTSNAGSMTTKMVLTNAGDLGIGTTAPARKLHVAGTARVDSTFYLGTDSACAFFRYYNSLVITNTASTSMQLGGGPGNVNNNVFVGNGYLDVNGYIRGKNYFYLEDANGTLRTTLRSESTYTTLDNGSNVLNYNAGNHYFLVGLSEKMRINSSGNVGIGTTSPGEKLEVNGTVKAVDGYKGYVSHFHNCGFFHSPRSSDGGNPLWIPINSTATSSSDQYYNTWVPLYAGRVRKVILKHISGSTPVATVCTFRKKINGTLDSTTYSGTVTGGGAAGMKVTFDFGTTNFTFNAEDEVQIGVVTGLPTQPGMGGMSCQIWYEYNIT